MTIKPLIFSLFVLGLMIQSASLQAAPKFVPGINDLPLMSGLSLKSETPVVFDTPGGRIVEVFATGAVAASRIRSFYAATLPQLGWLAKDTNTFQRDNEVLKIEISGTANDRQVVRFSVVPEK